MAKAYYRFSAEMVRDLSAHLEKTKRNGAPQPSVEAERLLREINERTGEKPRVKLVPARFDGRQAALWEDGRPWRGRLGPDVPVHCDHFGSPGRPAVLPLKTCLQRQAALWPAKSCHIYSYCANCPQGAEYKLRAAYCAEDDWASRSKTGSRRYQFYRKDSAVQQRERRIYLQSQPDKIVSDEEALEERKPELDLEDEDVKTLLGGG